MSDPTRRFSSRVANYIKYRPSYPAQVITILQQECDLSQAATIADIGSGTGILAQLFLEHGNQVFGVEPNREMREAGERLLHGYRRFVSVDGSAEATTLSDHSVDFITAGQAFHWFDRQRSRAEFTRILRPGGWVVLIWNDRRVAGTPFLEAYERILRTYGTDYTLVQHKNIDQHLLEEFFSPGGYRERSVPNRQHFDWEGLRGRLLSSSYTPEPGHPNFQPMLEALQRAFTTYQQNGQVTIEYDTLIYAGRLA